MTGPEMLLQWRNDFDVLTSAAAPGFEDTDIYMLLNRAYNDIILDLYSKQDWTSLQSLIYTSTYSSVTNLGSGQFYCYLPGFFSGDPDPKFWLYINSISRLFRSAYPSTGFIQSLQTTGLTTLVNNKIVTPSEFNNYIISVFNTNTIIKEPIAYLTNNALMVQVDSYSILSSIVYTYIKQFTSISDSFTCELQPSFHMSIVTLAVNYGIKSINSKEPQNARNN